MSTMHLSKNGKELEICGVIMKGSTLMATYYLTALIPICCKSHHHSFPNCFFPVNTPDCQRFHSSVIDKNSPNSRRKGLQFIAPPLPCFRNSNSSHVITTIVSTFSQTTEENEMKTEIEPISQNKIEHSNRGATPRPSLSSFFSRPKRLYPI